MNPKINVSDVIEKLGGTCEVARICRIKPASVSEWKQKDQIPPARLMYLEVAYPAVFSEPPADAENVSASSAQSES